MKRITSILACAIAFSLLSAQSCSNTITDTKQGFLEHIHERVCAKGVWCGSVQMGTQHECVFNNTLRDCQLLDCPSEIVVLAKEYRQCLDDIGKSECYDIKFGVPDSCVHFGSKYLSPRYDDFSDVTDEERGILESEGYLDDFAEY